MVVTHGLLIDGCSLISTVKSKFYGYEIYLTNSKWFSDTNALLETRSCGFCNRFPIHSCDGCFGQLLNASWGISVYNLLDSQYVGV